MSGRARTISLRTSALGWLRFGRRFPIVCTEFGPWRADAWGMSGAASVEVEVKQSAADLRREVESKRAKHHVYASAEKRASWCVPNHFYFLVPRDLESAAVEFAEEEVPFAGVAVSAGVPGRLRLFRRDDVWVVRRARKLHGGSPALDAVRAALMRMSSEICCRRAAQEVEGVPDDGVAERAADLLGVFDPEDRLGDLERRGGELAAALGDLREWGSLTDADRTRYCTAAARLVEVQRKSLGDGRYAEVV